MSRYDYEASRHLCELDPPFYALIMAAMRKADTANMARLCEAFPQTAAEFEARYHAPGGHLPSEPGYAELFGDAREDEQ